MSKAIAKRTTTVPAVYDPKLAEKRDAAADAVIAMAKRTKDWPALEDAVDLKLEDQAVFVEWWGVNVTPNRAHERNIRSYISATEAERLTKIKPMQVSKWKRRLGDRDAYREMLYGAAYRAAMAETDENLKANQNKGVIEWYTPAEYIEAAREAMGSIDVDPASSVKAQRIVKAEKFYTKANDGLTPDWPGNVFLNPPFRADLIKAFVAKLVESFGKKITKQAVLLTNNNTDTKWWHSAVRAASAVCFTEGRIAFYSPAGEEAAPTNGHTLVYLGSKSAEFKKHLEAFGTIMRLA